MLCINKQCHNTTLYKAVSMTQTETKLEKDKWNTKRMFKTKNWNTVHIENRWSTWIWYKWLRTFNSQRHN